MITVLLSIHILKLKSMTLNIFKVIKLVDNYSFIQNDVVNT